MDSYDQVNGVHTRYAYDTTGRLIRASTNTNQVSQYTYDASNNITKLLYRAFGQNRSTEYGYGLEERLESAQLPGGKTVTYGYDGFNRVNERKLGNLYTVTYEYESPSDGKTSNRLSRMVNGGTALSYTYDAVGNITAIKENGIEQVRYEYDSLNQLVREDSAVQNKSIAYLYDNGGNLLARKEYAYTTGELGGVLTPSATGTAARGRTF